MRNFIAAFSFTLLLAGAASAMGRYVGVPGAQDDRGGPSIPEPAAIAVFGVGAAVIGYALHRRGAK